MKKILEGNYIKEIYLQDAYYTINWTPYFKFDKFKILQKVPELSGLFVVSTLNKQKQLKPFYLGNSWMGSLRHDIKFLKDEDGSTDKEIIKILEDNECYYKYIIVLSHMDLEDIYMYYKFFYRDIPYIDESIVKDSGRYTNVYVKENIAGGEG